MTFNQFRLETDRLINFYGRTPPESLLVTGGLFSEILTLLNLKQALFRDLEKPIKSYFESSKMDDSDLSELYAYVNKIEKKLEKRYYQD